MRVVDDFSRCILAWELKSDMAADSQIDVIQQAVDLTGMTDVLLEDRRVLLSDNGSGYLSLQFSGNPGEINRQFVCISVAQGNTG